MSFGIVACAFVGALGVVDGGAVEGTVRLVGERPPSPTVITNTTDPEVCGDTQSLEDLLVGDDGGIRNVILAVEGAPAVAVEPERLVLDNTGCRFVPHAAVVTLGSTLEAKNSDAVLHTTHLYGPREMNLSLPIQGMRTRRVLDKAGLYAVKCDVHGWMEAFIRVAPHPFHAVTDAQGRFRIEGVPPGSYTLDIWHERLGRMSREVQIRPRESTSIHIEYRPEKTR